MDKGSDFEYEEEENIGSDISVGRARQ